MLISLVGGEGPRLAQVQLSRRACPSSSSRLIHSDVTIQCLWNPRFAIAMAVSQTSLTLHHRVNQAGEGYKKGELLFIHGHYGNQQRWEHTWKAVARCRIHHLGVFSSGCRELHSRSPGCPRSICLGSLRVPGRDVSHAGRTGKKQLNRITAKAAASGWVQGVPGPEAGCGSMREVSCWTHGCLISRDLALSGLFQFQALPDGDGGSFLSCVIIFNG